ncbi:hypothetical protein E2C01_056383 [Portunus trituberculatus]|uniref:Uncharacterized protein n=1 Tax=Portunus trituberculatus TaxID=210409 RepID=A0A5B7GXK7_PORTR|nr:hypothetical protein [Portunus trituberculatus]
MSEVQCSEVTVIRRDLCVYLCLDLRLPHYPAKLLLSVICIHTFTGSLVTILYTWRHLTHHLAINPNSLET